MSMVALALLMMAISLGAYMLIPSSKKRALLSRSSLAAIHGLFGTLGLAAYLSILAVARNEISMLVWTAASLTTIGFIFGAALFLQRRYTQNKPDLILTSHIIFAGMGALVIVVLLL
jgi:hypothetical protein